MSRILYILLWFRKFPWKKSDKRILIYWVISKWFFCFFTMFSKDPIITVVQSSDHHFLSKKYLFHANLLSFYVSSRVYSRFVSEFYSETLCFRRRYDHVRHENRYEKRFPEKNDVWKSCSNDFFLKLSINHRIVYVVRTTRNSIWRDTNDTYLRKNALITWNAWIMCCFSRSRKESRT